MTDTDELIDQGYCPDCRRYVTYGELWANGDITGMWACDGCLPAGTLDDAQRSAAEVDVERHRKHVRLAELVDTSDAPDAA